MEFRWMTGAQKLTDAYAIRVEVFCDEQGYAPAQEIDGVDTEPGTMHVVLYEGKEAIGVGRIYWKEPGVMGLGRIAVRKAWRGKGIGAKLVEEMNRKALEMGAQISRLDAQKRAGGFYEKLGYRVCGEEHMDGHVLHVMMEKHLDSSTIS